LCLFETRRTPNPNTQRRLLIRRDKRSDRSGLSREKGGNSCHHRRWFTSKEWNRRHFYTTSSIVVFVISCRERWHHPHPFSLGNFGDRRITLGSRDPLRVFLGDRDKWMKRRWRWLVKIAARWGWCSRLECCLRGSK
jgi:hypothetical protein